MASLLLTLGNMPTPPLAGALPEGLPPGASAEQRAYANHLLAVRSKYVGAHADDGFGDVEDFWEMAARLSAAIDSTAEEVWAQRANGAMELLRGAGRHSSLPWEERMDLPPTDPAHLLSFGPVPQLSPLRRRPEIAGADAYSSWEVFQKWAKRPVEVCGVHLDAQHPRELKTLMSSWVKQNIVAEGAYVVIKATRAKHGIWRVRASASEDANQEAIRTALGWSAVYVEGDAHALLLQTEVAMSHEYRVFIVGGRPVTGAGCVEEFTPLWNEGEAFDERTRAHRGVQLSSEAEEDFTFADEARSSTASAVGSNIELVQHFREAAAAIAAELPVRAATVDLAYLEATDEVAMIEANNLGNSGLYASRPLLVANALLEKARHG